MYNYNNEYKEPEFENEYEYNPEMESDYEMENFQNEEELNNEYENGYEINPEFEMEADNEYEEEYGNEFESGYEINPEFEMEADNEYENEFENEPEFESYSEYESAADEMEAELEYVTNEQEFESWVNKLVGKARRALRPVLRTPLGKRAVKQFSKIAFKTLPYIGRRRRGWRRPYPKYRYPRRRWWQYRYPVPGSIIAPTQAPGAWGQPQPFQSPGMPQQQFQDNGMSQQQPPSQNMDGSQEPQIQQDGSFKNFVLETLKSLTDQIAKGNESLAALKNSMTNSAVNNFPAIVQPKTGTDQPPADMKGTTAGPPTDTTTKEPAPSSEFEMEDYEYNMETNGEVIDSESSFNEVTEMGLASELLNVNNEMELDHFFGKLLKKALGGLTGILNTPQGKILKRLLKQVAKKALPVAGAAAGTYFGGPLGAQAGEKIGNTAAGMFELELEGLSNEDREFETAKAVVRFSGNAAKQVHDHRTGNPGEDVRHAVIQAATRYAPGLIIRRDGRFNNYDYSGYNSNYNTGANSGNWYRRGNRIVIENAF